MSSAALSEGVSVEERMWKSSGAARWSQGCCRSSVACWSSAPTGRRLHLRLDTKTNEDEDNSGNNAWDLEAISLSISLCGAFVFMLLRSELRDELCHYLAKRDIIVFYYYYIIEKNAEVCRFHWGGSNSESISLFLHRPLKTRCPVDRACWAPLSGTADKLFAALHEESTAVVSVLLF